MCNVNVQSVQYRILDNNDVLCNAVANNTMQCIMACRDKLVTIKPQRNSSKWNNLSEDIILNVVVFTIIGDLLTS